MDTAEIVALLKPEERLAMLLINDEVWYGFPSLAADLNLEVSACKQVVRGLRALGLLEYGPLHRQDEIELAGSGYWPSIPGGKVRSFLQNMTSNPPK